MKHQYITENFWKRSIQSSIDFFVDLYSRVFIRKEISKNLTEPKNILFVTLGHLGDALIGSYIFPLLKGRYPNAQIDVLAGEWCKPVLSNNPNISRLIFLNHFRINRSGISFWKKILIHIKSSRSALKTIRSNHYDLSIEGRISHPNGNLICYRGKVKRRIGFGSGGFGSLLTDEIPFPSNQNFHMLDAILGELKLVGIHKAIENLNPYFNLSNRLPQMTDLVADFIKEPFIILHVETGKDYLPERLIKEDFWLEIVQLVFSNTKFKVIVCGTTKKSTNLFEFLQLNLSNFKSKLLSAVNIISLDEFFLLSHYAIAAITVDSLAAHLCAVNCDTISFYKNGFGALYFPISNMKAIVIHNHVSSKNINIRPNTISDYVNEVESEKTFSIFTERLKKLI